MSDGSEMLSDLSLLKANAGVGCYSHGIMKRLDQVSELLQVWDDPSTR